MDPSKALNSGHSYFCKESSQAFQDTDLTNNLRSWKELIQLLKDHRKIAVRLLKGDEKEYINWLKRCKDCMGDFEIVMTGGDLKQTNDYRVVDGTNIFYGTKKECIKYMAGEGLKFEGDNVINEEGRVFKSIEQARKDCDFEVRYYDDIDDIEFWHDA